MASYDARRRPVWGSHSKWAARSTRVFVWRRVQAPEGRLQAETPKDVLRLPGGPATKVGSQPVAIPEPREFPGLAQRQRLASLIVIASPRLRAFFRPEE
jgi:hypothetical protein